MEIAFARNSTLNKKFQEYLSVGKRQKCDTFYLPIQKVTLFDNGYIRMCDNEITFNPQAKEERSTEEYFTSPIRHTTT
jgi:hypothetical protein